MQGPETARSARSIYISNDGGTQDWVIETRCVQRPPGHYRSFTSLYIFCKDFSHLEIMCSCKTPSSLNNVSLGRNVFVELLDFVKLDLAVILNNVEICGKIVTRFCNTIARILLDCVTCAVDEVCCFMTPSLC
jgi:hypothetical protein